MILRVLYYFKPISIGSIDLILKLMFDLRHWLQKKVNGQVTTWCGSERELNRLFPVS